jgi:hypothetical protein
VAIDAAPLQRALEDEPASSQSATGATSGAPSEASAAAPGQPQPDLYALARQVYTVLKRRLAAERRRVD